MRAILIILSLLICSACQQDVPTLIGKYELKVEGIKNVNRGEMLIIGEPGDYFGKISFFGSKTRVYEIGLKEVKEDSIFFMLPGNGGYLRFMQNETAWYGKFKYFGLEAKIEAVKTDEVLDKYVDLVKLKPLAPDIVSTDREESFPTYDNTNEILYFTRDQKIYASTYDGNNWGKPEIMPFSDRYNDSAPYLIDSGKSMLFTSNRPIFSNQQKKNLWKVDKVNDNWVAPSPLPHPVNIDSLGDYHAGISDLGNIYFVSYNRQSGYGRSDIFIASEATSGQYTVSNLGSMINSERSEADVYVHPKEEYIIFASTSREDSYGTDDLYISYNLDNGWSQPKNLGPLVNSYAYEYGAWVDEKANFLYFNSYRRGSSDIYRIKLDELAGFRRK